MEYIGIKVTLSGGEDRSHGNVCRIERSRAEIKSEKMPDAKKQTDMIQVDDRVYEHKERRTTKYGPSKPSRGDRS